jgi:hypothetical protein
MTELASDLGSSESRWRAILAVILSKKASTESGEAGGFVVDMMITFQFSFRCGVFNYCTYHVAR